MADVPLKCSCGKVRGVATNISPRTGNRAVCYCDDCQAFARYLGREADIQDEYGGTEVFQITPAQVTINQGADQLRCMRLRPKGLIRWYTDCCKTPVGNTVSATLPFVGLIHNFMDNKDTRDTQLGPVRYYVQGKFARGKPARHVDPGFPLRSFTQIIPWLLLAMLRRQNKPNPFFDAAGKPVSAPYILDPEG
jgi:hypothetical protein